MTIKQRICEIFPGINWKSLNGLKHSRLRLRLRPEKTLAESIEFADRISERIFSGDTHACFMLFNKSERPSKGDLDSLRKRGLSEMVETVERDIFKIDDHYFCLQYFLRITNENREKINKAIAEEDFWIDPTVSIRCYYFDLEDEICFHLYDDRGIDILWKEGKLEEIYNQYAGQVDMQLFKQ